MNKIISVVIPSYNVEKYLDTTLSSFIDEQILADIEVLVVDDGSKDRTAEIAKKYADQYPETFRLISKENGGHGSTINVGIQEACGKYFKVVDGDDWVNTAGFVSLVHSLKNCNSDFVYTNYSLYYDDVNKEEKVTFSFLKPGQEYSFAEVCEENLLQMHALVIKTSILKDNQIRLDEKCFYVDVEYVLFPVPYVKTVTFFDCYVYMYRLSLDTQSVSIKGFQKHKDDHIRVCMRLLDFAREYKGQANAVPQYVNYIETRVAEIVRTQSTIYSSFPWDDKAVIAEFKAFDTKVKAANPDVYVRAGQISKKLMLLRKTNFKFYKFIQFLSEKANG
ncbi:MAG: glycosyltransferase family 2 protein [Candidatus Fimenecus sp.]